MINLFNYIVKVMALAGISSPKLTHKTPVKAQRKCFCIQFDDLYRIIF